MYLISLISIFIGFLLLLISFISLMFNTNKPINKKEKFNPCILIPARDESRVIESLLISIKEQTLKVKDIYIIVEDKFDKTVEIAHKYNVNIIVRKNLDLKTKGYAIDEAIKKMDKSYNCYFIFDADNILDKYFFEEMKKTYLKGYDIATSYRNSKNGNVNIYSACSSLTFSMINTIGNEKKKNGNIIISGTGYYIDGKIIKELNGFPFTTLTEDYELTLYSILEGYTTYYNKEAIFFDEQPESFRTTIVQRTRWIKGFISSRRKYLLKIIESLSFKDKNIGSKINIIIGIWPYLFMIFGYLMLVIKFIIDKNLLLIIISLLFIYLVLQIFTIYMLLKENKLNLNLKTKIKTILFNPLFLITYIWCAIKALLFKNIKWDKIEHSESKII